MVEILRKMMNVTNSQKTYLYAVGIASILNSIIWSILGFGFLKSFEIAASLWWLLFCVVFTFAISISIAMKNQSNHVNPYVWIIGTTLIVSIVCAFISGYINAYRASVFASWAFFNGMALGGLLGSGIGFFISISTFSRIRTSNQFFRHLVVDVVISTVVGIILIVAAILIFAYSEWVKDGPFYPFVSYAIAYLFIFVPIGILPSVTTGFSTSIITQTANWWFNRQKNLSTNEGVG